MKDHDWSLLGLVLLVVVVLVLLFSSCGVVTKTQQAISGQPVAHDMGNGVMCYSYETGLSCLRTTP